MPCSRSAPSALDDFHTDTRVAAGERHQLRQDHEAYDPVAEILAHPRRVRANDVLLELREFVVADADMGEMPAAGVDPIDGPASLDRVFDRVRGGGDPPTRPPPRTTVTSSSQALRRTSSGTGASPTSILIRYRPIP